MKLFDITFAVVLLTVCVLWNARARERICFNIHNCGAWTFTWIGNKYTRVHMESQCNHNYSKYCKSLRKHHKHHTLNDLRACIVYTLARILVHCSTFQTRLLCASKVKHIWAHNKYLNTWIAFIWVFLFLLEKTDRQTDNHLHTNTCLSN